MTARYVRIQTENRDIEAYLLICSVLTFLTDYDNLKKV